MTDIKKLFPAKEGFGDTLHFVPRADYDALQAALVTADKMADMFESLLYDEPAREPGIYDIDALDAYKAARAMKGKPNDPQ